MQAGLTIAASAAVVTIVSIVADRRRQRRHDLEDVGLMPWTLLTVVGVLVTLFAMAFAIKGAGS